ncbi:NERD domain-containing protein [Prevotella copri]|nr:NERD domain-containing protein [Segatella copri]MCP9573400.1 NERD domain-containing protein [Segatella copri]MCP9576467.1 NERD domain-containing protein [Segatella copri]MCP9579251.1 NERD domain-containing protein [Segatella copri]MCP9582354.1 NERD domain-containing protein [Segatella copri]
MLQLSDEYTIFNNLLFESNGRSTQIDHIVVSPYGVFVIWLFLWVFELS